LGQFDFTPSDPENCAAAFKAAIDYRSAINWDTDAEECIRRHEAYTAADVIGEEQATIKRTISLPIIHGNNNRKIASIGSVNVKPIIYSEIYGGDAFSQIRSAVLRWGVRVSQLAAAIEASNAYLVMLGQAPLQLLWDADALDGQGAPVFEVKDPRNVFLDGRRRQWDINRECRWIFEKQKFSRAECEDYWPDYFKDHPGGLLNKETVIHSTPDAYVKETASTEGDDIDVIFVEYAATEKNKNGEFGRKIVKCGIFDFSGKAWVQEPRDNGLCMFSYIINGLQPGLGRAYPVAPNLAEHELARLVNLAYTLFIHSSFKNADGPVFYDAEDRFLEKALNGRDHFEIGEWVPVEKGNIPQQIKQEGQQDFLQAAQVLHAIANESSDIAAVQRGNAPRGVSSGRALNILTASADLGMEQYRAAVKRAFIQGCTAMDRMLRVKMPDYRELIVRDGQQIHRVPVNAVQGEPEYEELSNAADESAAPVYETARMYDKHDIYVGSARIAIAERKMRSGEIKNFKKVLNDITVGGLEVDVELEPITSRAERAQTAILLMQMDKLDLLTGLSELGFENPSLIVERLKAENEALQIGQTVMQDPVLMQAMDVLSSDPLWREFISNPEARGQLKMELAARALKRQPTPQAGATQ
jgi:hypothetical protein